MVVCSSWKFKTENQLIKTRAKQFSVSVAKLENIKRRRPLLLLNNICAAFPCFFWHCVCVCWLLIPAFFAVLVLIVEYMVVIDELMFLLLFVWLVYYDAFIVFVNRPCGPSEAASLVPNWFSFNSFAAVFMTFLLFSSRLQVQFRPKSNTETKNKQHLRQCNKRRSCIVSIATTLFASLATAAF